MVYIELRSGTLLDEPNLLFEKGLTRDIDWISMVAGLLQQLMFSTHL